MNPKTRPNPKSVAGVLRLNGIVWGIMVLGYINAINATSGPFQNLGGIALALLAAVTGTGTNAVLSIWKLSKGNRYQALLHFLAVLPLVAVAGWLWSGLRHIGKIGG